MQLQREIQVLKHGLDEFGNLIFPKHIHCICCGDSISESRVHGLCDSCKEKITWIDYNPMERQMDEFAFDEVLACCIYGFYARRVISSFKLMGNPGIGEPVAALMTERLEDYGYSGGELLVSIPMHREKKARRGFNQTEILAQLISKKTGLEYHKNLAFKDLSTKSSRMSSGQERRLKRGDIYRLNEDLVRVVKGRNIILVDDVITTGSTADGFARFLRDFGAQNITVLCFASGSSFNAQTIDK